MTNTAIIDIFFFLSLHFHFYYSTLTFNIIKLNTKVFGDMLLMHLIDENATQLSSPHPLRRRIILKYKKLPKVEDGMLPRSADETDSIRNMP